MQSTQFICKPNDTNNIILYVCTVRYVHVVGAHTPTHTHNTRHKIHNSTVFRLTKTEIVRTGYGENEFHWERQKRISWLHFFIYWALNICLHLVVYDGSSRIQRSRLLMAPPCRRIPHCLSCSIPKSKIETPNLENYCHLMATIINSPNWLKISNGFVFMSSIETVFGLGINNKYDTIPSDRRRAMPRVLAQMSPFDWHIGEHHHHSDRHTIKII